MEAVKGSEMNESTDAEQMEATQELNCDYVTHHTQQYSPAKFIALGHFKFAASTTHYSARPQWKPIIAVSRKRIRVRAQELDSM